MSDITLESLYQSHVAAQEPESEEPGQPETEPEGAEDDETVEEVQDDAETDADDEPEGDESEEEPEGEDQPEEESEQDRVIKWKTAEGEEYEVPESELKNGYMRDQDYRHKTQALATEREKASGEFQNAMQRVNAYGEQIAQLGVVRHRMGSLESALQQINREDDPGRYATYQAELLSVQRAHDQLVQSLSQSQQQMQNALKQEVAQKQQQVLGELQAEIPGFSSDMLKTWDEAARSYGFTAEELSTVTDKRMLKMLADAAKFRELQTRKPVAVKKTEQAPRKSAKKVVSAPASTTVRAIKRFERTGSLEDLAAAYGAR